MVMHVVPLSELAIALLDGAVGGGDMAIVRLGVSLDVRDAAQRVLQDQAAMGPRDRQRVAITRRGNCSCALAAP